jgi:hypothetical protein
MGSSSSTHHLIRPLDASQNSSTTSLVFITELQVRDPFSPIPCLPPSSNFRHGLKIMEMFENARTILTSEN